MSSGAPASFEDSFEFVGRSRHDPSTITRREGSLQGVLIDPGNGVGGRESDNREGVKGRGARVRGPNSRKRKQRRNENSVTAITPTSALPRQGGGRKLLRGRGAHNRSRVKSRGSRIRKRADTASRVKNRGRHMKQRSASRVEDGGTGKPKTNDRGGTTREEDSQSETISPWFRFP